MEPNGIIRFYRVEFIIVSNNVDQEFGSTTDSLINDTFTTNTSVIITMLEQLTTYKVQVFATTTVEGEGSDVVTITTDEDSELIYFYNNCDCLSNS